MDIHKAIGNETFQITKKEKKSLKGKLWIYPACRDQSQARKGKLDLRSFDTGDDEQKFSGKQVKIL